MTSFLSRPEARRVIHEVHPEVAFRRLNGDRPLTSAKKGPERQVGLAERRALLRNAGLPASLVDAARPRGIGADDHLDSLAALVVARDIFLGRAIPLPDPPGRDRHGLARGDLGSRWSWSDSLLNLDHDSPSDDRNTRTLFKRRDSHSWVSQGGDSRRSPSRRSTCPGLRPAGPAAPDRVRGATADRSLEAGGSNLLVHAGWGFGTRRKPRGSLSPGTGRGNRGFRCRDRPTGCRLAMGRSCCSRCCAMPANAISWCVCPMTKSIPTRLAETEDSTVLGTRWWTLDELDATGERIEPAGLARIARRIANG